MKIIAPEPPVAGLVALRLRREDFWYAELFFDPPPDGDNPLYRQRDALIADLAMDGITDAEFRDNGQVDIDRARGLIGYDMSTDEIGDVITAWNVLDDLTKSFGVPLGFHGRLADRVYDKLFYGLNLEYFTPPGEWYVPTWQPRELAKIDQVLRECGTRVAAASKQASGRVEE